MNLSRIGSVLRAFPLLVAVVLPPGLAAASPIYNGGPLISGVSHVYLIWYGNWGSDSAKTILPTFLQNLSGTSYLNVVTSYSTQSYTVSNQVDLAGQADVVTSTPLDVTPGATGTDSVYSIVENALNANPSWTSDTRQAIFDVLTAPGTSVTVNASYGPGFDAIGGFCGWHSSALSGAPNYGLNLDSLGIQYGFIGDPGSSAGVPCLGSNPNSPSATNIGVDAMTSTIAHELFETVTDPTGAAWIDTVSGSLTAGYEGADMCLGHFGAPTTTNGQTYDVTMGGTNYYLQELWLNQGGGSGGAGGVCTMSLALSSSVPEPASVLLLLPALVGLAGMRWRRIAEPDPD